MSSRTFGAIVEAIGAILGRSKTNYETGFSHLGGQKAPQREAKGSKIKSKRRLELKMS